MLQCSTTKSKHSVRTTNQYFHLIHQTRMKDGYAERVKEMTRSLEQLQAASEKREAMEKKLRAKLEEELADYRSKRRADSGGAGSASAGGAGADSDGEGADELAIKLGEAEEKVN